MTTIAVPEAVTVRTTVVATLVPALVLAVVAATKTLTGASIVVKKVTSERIALAPASCASTARTRVTSPAIAKKVRRPQENK